jgi:hypothetical protein
LVVLLVYLFFIPLSEPELPPVHKNPHVLNIHMQGKEPCPTQETVANHQPPAFFLSNSKEMSLKANQVS